MKNYFLECEWIEVGLQKRLLGLVGRVRRRHCLSARSHYKEIDLARPQQNKDNIMFTKEERGKLSNLMSLGFVDSFRKFNKGGGNYTWWMYGNDTRQKNLGWRIDYIVVSKSLETKLQSAAIHPKVSLSDHCPVEVVLK